MKHEEEEEEGEIKEEANKKRVPLSLEEIIARKKAEEEATSKVMHIRQDLLECWENFVWLSTLDGNALILTS